MQMPVQLYALIWSNEERAKIEEWAQEHGDKVGIVSFSRVMLEPLHTACQDPALFSLAIDGVVIADHLKWPHDTLKQALNKLHAGSFQLYAVSNGLEPVSLPAPAQY